MNAMNGWREREREPDPLSQEELRMLHTLASRARGEVLYWIALRRLERQLRNQPDGVLRVMLMRLAFEDRPWNAFADRYAAIGEKIRAATQRRTQDALGREPLTRKKG
jgi:hypothetical protein